MGQLESYTMQDIYLIAIMSGVLSTYFAEEIEATIESVVSYVYSANGVSRKKIKLLAHKLPAGDIIGAMHYTENLLGLTKAKFIIIEKPIDEKTIWQDQFLGTLTHATKKGIVAKLEDKYNWNA